MTKRRCRHFDPREAGAAISLRSDRGVVTSGGFVDSWTSTAGSVVANGSGTARPAFVASDANFGGFPSFTFDGTNDLLTMSAGALSVFQNVGRGRIFAVCHDTNSTGGTGTHTVATWTTAVNNARARIDTRLSSSAGLISFARRLDADSISNSGPLTPVNVPIIADSNLDWSGNQNTISRNGVAATAVAFSSGAGSTSNTASTFASIGETGFGLGFFPGPITQVTVFNTAIDAALAARVRHAAAYAFNFACA